MAWTAKITDKSLSEGKLSVTVELDNGTEKFGERFTIPNAQSPEWLKDRINERIKVLTDLSTYADSLSVGEVDLTPTAIPEPEPPSKEETDRNQFVQDFTKLQQLQKALQVGLVKKEDIDAQGAIVKSKFKPEYLDILNG